jgi:hypothetical protein
MPTYQLDLITPGISPLKAKVLKQILQTPNFLKKALLLPQIGHRLYLRVENFGLPFAFAIKDFLAKATSFSPPK